VTPQSRIDLVITTRKQLVGSGLDADPDTLAWHLRHGGTLYSIGAGRTRVLVLVEDRDIRVLATPPPEDSLKELVLDTTKRYQGTDQPPEPPPKNHNGCVARQDSWEGY
jgi:hypothetical protein